MRVLLIAPNIDPQDVGESFVAFKWCEALSRLLDLTILTFQRPGRPNVRDHLPLARVITWAEPAWALKHERLNAMLKPAWPIFSKKVRNWISENSENGESFDLAHQLMPIAARYPSPLRHFQFPYIIGPLGGSIQTPRHFRSEISNAPLFTYLRGLDKFRFRYDPWLRSSYIHAACIIGIAPYVRENLSEIELCRFEPLLELGIDDVADTESHPREDGELRVLHVGRAVRTKGLRDVVRAMELLQDLPKVTLTSAGSGEEIDICHTEAKRLGVHERVTFLGRVSRDQVEDLYASHDVFCFPSFREPSGGVLYEAMRHGLPVVTADNGGPGWIIDNSSGIKIPVTEPERFAKDIADSLRKLALNPPLRKQLGNGARAKVKNEGLWPSKASRLFDLYKEIAEEHSVA